MSEVIDFPTSDPGPGPEPPESTPEALGQRISESMVNEVGADKLAASIPSDLEDQSAPDPEGDAIPTPEAPPAPPRRPPRDLMKEAVEGVNNDDFEETVYGITTEIGKILKSLDRPSMNPVNRNRLFLAAYRLMGQVQMMTTDLVLSLDDGARTTFLSSHGNLIQLVLKMDQTMRKELDRRFDDYTMALYRTNNKMARMENTLGKLEHSLQALFYILCEHGAFTHVDPEVKQSNFEQSFAAYQVAATSVYEQRLGIERRRGAWGELRLIGNPVLRVFNLGAMES